MKKDKKTKINFLWSPGRKSPSLLKNFIIFSFLGITFFISIIILIYRHINNVVVQPPLVFHRIAPQTVSSPPPPPEVAPPLASQFEHLENEIALQNNRLESLENRLNQVSTLSPALSKIIAYEMLHNILEGLLPVNAFICYLQKTPEPWAVEILNLLSPVKDGKTYTQLQELFIILPSPEPSFTWKRVKKVLNSFITIRKIDNKGNDVEENIDDIKVALNEHRIQRALIIFDKLPPEQQAQLVNWKQAAQDRLALEMIKQKLLLELSEGRDNPL